MPWYYSCGYHGAVTVGFRWSRSLLEGLSGEGARSQPSGASVIRCIWHWGDCLETLDQQRKQMPCSGRGKEKVYAFHIGSTGSTRVILQVTAMFQSADSIWIWLPSLNYRAEKEGQEKENSQTVQSFDKP